MTDASMAPEPSPTCFHHTDRETGLRCTRCGRPACWQCLTDAPVGAHCWECIKGARPPLQQRVVQQVRTDRLLLTKALIAVNLAVFVLGLVGSDGLNSQIGREHIDWAVFGPSIAGGEWWRLVTAGFLHYGLFHVGMNMFILWQLGQTLEGGIGIPRFASIAAVSLLGGSFGALVLSPESFTAGASGMVFGLAAAATVALRQRGVPFMSSGWGPMLAINLLITFTLPRISVGGHLGGLVFGGICGLVMLDPRPSRRPAVGFAVAGVLAVVAIAGSLVFVQAKYGTCTLVDHVPIVCEK